MNFGFHKIRGIYWLAEELLASQEILWYTEWVNKLVVLLCSRWVDRIFGGQVIPSFLRIEFTVTSFLHAVYVNVVPASFTNLHQNTLVRQYTHIIVRYVLWNMVRLWSSYHQGTTIQGIKQNIWIYNSIFFLLALQPIVGLYFAAL
jgi:hypothetical protein